MNEVDSNRQHFDDLATQLATAVDNQLTRAIDEIDATKGDNRNGLDELRTAAVESLPGVLRDAGLKELTEFGRAVHAEMTALLARGISMAIP